MVSTDTFSQNYQRQDSAPAFFMPQQELMPQYEKLPPIKQQNTNQPKSSVDEQYDIKYVLVDGVYMPTFTKKQVVVPYTDYNHPSVKPNNDIAENIDNNNIHDVQPKIQVAKAPQSTVEKPQNSTIELPASTTLKDGIPPYRNIYAKYLADTQIFQKKGSFPENKDLEKSLNKMKSGKQITLFRGNVTPVLKK